MNKNIITVLFAGCACGLFTYAQSNSTQVSASDRTFMHKAAEGGLAEVQLGQLAEQKAWSRAVKDFGQRMVKDHGQSDEQLQGIASSQGVTLPNSLDAKDKTLYDRLSLLAGAAFDRVYMRAMVRDHQQDIAEFQKESQTAHDQAVGSFASMTLPTLEDHLHLARKVRHDLGISATAEANGTDEDALQK